MELLCTTHTHVCMYIHVGTYIISLNLRTVEIIFDWREKIKKISLPIISRLISLAIYQGRLWTWNFGIFWSLSPSESQTQNLKLRKVTNEQLAQPSAIFKVRTEKSPMLSALDQWQNNCKFKHISRKTSYVEVLKKNILPDAAVNWTICCRKEHLQTCWLRFSEKGKEKKRFLAVTRTECTL